MCGIAGLFGFQGGEAALRRIVQRMTASIRHRGPDEQGLYVDAAAGVGLGHARLSIIDLSSGQQPMSHEGRSVWVTFNGEIFNYIEISRNLAKQGHAFRTHSDTETIVHQYEETGPACVDAFNGDFAFALFDQRRRRLLIARDRMGVRPVYYTTTADGCLAFASEAKALFQVPGITPEIDPVALDQCFTFWFPIAPRTPFKNISELPPAHALTPENARTTR